MKLEIKSEAQPYVESVKFFETKTPMVRILAKSGELASDMDRKLCLSCEAHKLGGFFCSAMMIDQMAIMCDVNLKMSDASPIIEEVIAKSSCIGIVKSS